MSDKIRDKKDLLPFRSAACAMITPFDDNGKVDHKALESLLDIQLSCKMPAVVILGTTAETPTLSDIERSDILSHSASIVGKKMKMIVGSGSNDPKKAVRYTENALKMGADAILAVTPYYNKCNRDGLIKYYKLIAAVAEGKPVILYNVPSRTGVEITPDVVYELAGIPNIVAYKEAGNDFSKSCALLASGIIPVYSGNDDLTLPILSLGGVGCISVSANIIPNEIKNMCDDFFEGRHSGALALHDKYYKFTKAIFGETNPIGIKYAMSLLGLCKPYTRLPLGDPGKTLCDNIKREMKALKLI